MVYETLMQRAFVQKSGFKKLAISYSNDYDVFLLVAILFLMPF